MHTNDPKSRAEQQLLSKHSPAGCTPVSCVPDRNPNSSQQSPAVNQAQPDQLKSGCLLHSPGRLVPGAGPAKSLSALAALLITRNAQEAQPSTAPAPNPAAMPIPSETLPTPVLQTPPHYVIQGLAPISALPDGELNRDHLSWHQKAWYSNIYVVASLPASRLEDFVKGEGRKGLTTFFKQRSKVSKDVKQQQQGKVPVIVRKIVYRCAFGPEDKTLMQPLLQIGERGLLSSGQPRKRAKRVESTKRGCQACFEAISYDTQPEVVEIRYQNVLHVNAAGRVCHGEGFAEGGRASLAPNLSQEVREAVQKALAAGHQHTDIIRQVRESCVEKYREAKGFATLEEARKAIDEKGGFIDRDYLITCKDVANIASKMKNPEDRAKRRKASPATDTAQEAPKAPKRVEIVLLGTAQDAGVPQIMCKCLNCLAVKFGGAAPQWPASLAIIDHSTQRFYIVDATPDFRHQVTFIESRHPTYRLGGILLTHLHMGHYTGLLQLGKEGLHSKYLPVYCSSKVGAFLSETEPWKQLRDNHNVQLRVFSSPLKEETIGNFSVVPVLVPHRSELSDTLAFKFRPHPPRQDVNGKEGTFYCPDTDGWDGWHKSPKEYLAGTAVSVIDATFYSPKELPGRDMSKIPHPTVEQTIEALEGMDMEGRVPEGKRIVLTHLNHTNPLLRASPEQQLVLEKGFLIAHLGMQWDLT